MLQAHESKGELLPVAASGGYAVLTYINKEPSK
jgi:S-adenosylmethionine:diacylglycerol 3-amino-3-carboxypropyl transferase